MRRRWPAKSVKQPASAVMHRRARQADDEGVAGAHQSQRLSESLSQAVGRALARLSGGQVDIRGNGSQSGRVQQPGATNALPRPGTGCSAKLQ